MRRLYLQIYLTLIGVVLLFMVLASIAWMIAPDRPRERHVFEEMARLAAEILPPAEAGRDALQDELERLQTSFAADLAVFGAEGEQLAAVGETLGPPQPGRESGGWIRGAGRGATLALHLPDGRWVVLRHRHEGGGMGFAWLAPLLLLAIAAGLGAWPVVRRLTRRLERLQSRVDALGAGDLSARVEPEGRDEVADLARSFNRAADRIERLVNAQKTLLASASHELRSPLTRMRLAIELLAGEDRPELREQVARDIGELDELIGELLLASKLDALADLEKSERVDLLALAAEETARAGVELTGEPLEIRGDPRMLRRLLRNLIENGLRYGGDAGIEVCVGRDEEQASVRVEDRGPGVPEAERERVFEPFYRLPGTPETGEGVGLGLALVRQIARHHGGDARCLPRPGGGTRFEVNLPLPRSPLS